MCRFLVAVATVSHLVVVAVSHLVVVVANVVGDGVDGGIADDGEGVGGFLFVAGVGSGIVFVCV